MTPPHSTAFHDAESRVRVLTVDDQAMFRQVARDVIEATPGFVAVGEAAGGEEALEAVRRLQPDLVLCDVRMPGMDGVEVANCLADSHPDTVVVLVSIEEPVDVLTATRCASAARLVRKQGFSPRLLRELWSGPQRS